jgi:hypothetical protein
LAVSFENQRSSGIKIINGHDLPVFGARRFQPQRAAREKAFDASGIPLNELRTQCRSRRKRAGARITVMFAGDNFTGRGILTML